MKLDLRFFIPLVGITALSVSTPAADMLSHSGHARTRLEYAKNIGAVDSDFSEQWLNRVRLNVDISPSKTVMVRLTPQAAYTWGSINNTTGLANNVNLTAQEAWMSWTASDLLTLYVGRQMLSYGNGLIIGNNDWGQSSNYFDALRARFSFDLGTTDIFFAKLNERPTGGYAAVASATTGETADRELYGLYTALNPDMGVLKNADLYVLWNDNRVGGATRNRLATLGVRIDGDVNIIDYNLEVTAQFGKAGSQDMKGIQASASAGAKVGGAHHIGLGLDYANSEFANQFPDQHAQLGKADIFTRDNILAFSLKTAWKLHEKWGAHVDGWYFLAAKDDNRTTGSVAQVAGKRQGGLEADFALTYSPEKALAFDFGYDVFKGMDAIKPADQVFSGLYIQGTVNF